MTESKQKPLLIVVNLRDYGLKDGQDIFDVIAEMRSEKLDDEQIVMELDKLAVQFGRRSREHVVIEFPGQPKPFGIPKPVTAGTPATRDREIISNSIGVTREVPKEDGSTEKKLRFVASSLEEIRRRVSKVADGWPLRVRAPGAKTPLLFIDEFGADNPRWLGAAEHFETWLHEIACCKFTPKQDCEGTNFEKTSNVFHSFGGSAMTQEFLAVETRPHEPPMSKTNGFDGDHYYKWSPPAGYDPDGQYLRQLIAFFDNTLNADWVKEDPEEAKRHSQYSRALIAAAILTPFWGGPYGKRPAIVITAPEPGCGKSTLAWAISRVAGGSLSFDMSQKAEDDITTRLLSTDALTKRVVIIDNVKGTLKSPKVERMITDEWINGRRLYTGDASRPNTLTYLITANGVRLSRDMASRSFFIELRKPAYRSGWDQKLSEFITLHADEVVADCVMILKTRPPANLGISDRWARWCDEVLVAACTHEALAEVVGAVDVAALLRANNATRDESDEDREEADMFMAALLDRVTFAENLICVESGIRVVRDARHDAWIPSPKMCEHWHEIFGGKKLGAKSILHILKGHREAGRIKGLFEKHTNSGNGYVVTKEVLQRYIDAVRDGVSTPELLPRKTQPNNLLGESE